MKKPSLFEQYVVIREESGAAPPTVTSRIKLQKKPGETSGQFAPFTVNRTQRPNLRLLIKAFADSDKVGVGYTTVEKGKGEVEPQLKKKMLYLTGGAVRDHLRGKTPRDYNLVTDATVSEMRMILTQPEAGFTEVKPREGEFAKGRQYGDKTPAGSKNKVFWVSGWDKTGKEMKITVELNGEKFEIATMSKNPKSQGNTPDEGQFASSVEEDAANRDFTINSMYIPLTQADGDNTELIDPHGGAHHLQTGEVSPVGGDLTPRLREDPGTAQRYVKLLTKFGDPSKIPDKHKQAIANFKDLSGMPKDRIRKEFLDGLESSDVDPRKYLGAYQQTGLMSTIFPGVDFDDKDMPENFQGDRWLAPAFILRNNDPEQVKEILVAGSWSKQEASDIAYLVKLYQWGSKGKFNPEQFYDMKQQHTGLTKSKIREWLQMVKLQGHESDSFLNHDDSDLKPMVSGPDGKRGVNPEYVKHLGRAPQGHEFDDVRKQLSTKRFSDNLKKKPHPQPQDQGAN